MPGHKKKGNGEENGKKSSGSSGMKGKGKLKKGSKEAKDYMAKLRAKRGKK